MQPQAGIHSNAQTVAQLDFLTRFSANQRMLVSQLFRALGESESIGYASSLEILRDHDAEARAYAEAVLKAAGKVKGGSSK